MAQVLVMYPTGHEFDHEYYMKTHMPLVDSTWGHVGLQSWNILRFPEGQAFQVCAVLTWDNLDSFNKVAGGDGAKTVFGDIENFTTAKPTVLSGEIVRED